MTQSNSNYSHNTNYCFFLEKTVFLECRYSMWVLWYIDSVGIEAWENVTIEKRQLRVGSPSCPTFRRRRVTSCIRRWKTVLGPSAGRPWHYCSHYQAIHNLWSVNPCIWRLVQDPRSADGPCKRRGRNDVWHIICSAIRGPMEHFQPSC